MSDPAQGPYSCHGDMTALHFPNQDVCAYICEVCGVARNALPRSDPRRAQAETVIATVLAAMQIGSRGGVE